MLAAGTTRSHRFYTNTGKLCKLGNTKVKVECCCVIDTISLIRLNENTFHHMSADEFTSFECITVSHLLGSLTYIGGQLSSS